MNAAVTSTRIVMALRLAANSTRINRGDGPPDPRCRVLDELTGVVLLFTRDAGMHASGWFKNPDFERCWHLSISGFDPVTRDRRIVTRAEASTWAKAVLGDGHRLAWIESAKTARGIELGIVHYRVFCDEAWAPIKPRREVYTREFTEKGWQSWIDRHGAAPEPSILHAG